MSLLFRGVVWFGLYLLLALLPLLAAMWADPYNAPRPWQLEVALALGFIGFALMVLEYTLVARLHAAAEPFGTDALVSFHRLMGLATVAFALAHPAMLELVPGLRADRAVAGSGLLALLALLILAATSIWRRRLGLRWESWDRIHRACAALAVLSTLAHIGLAQGYARSGPAAWAVLAFALLFAALLLRFRLWRPLRLRARPWRVLSNQDAGGSARLLRVAPDGHPGWRFRPGQFAWLITGRSPFSIQQHPISLAGDAEAADGHLEFGIKALGDWSGEVVPRLAPGDRVWVDGPYGAFTPDREPAQGFVLIAGGIGVAPMRAILLSLKSREDPRHIVLIVAAHDRERVVFREELEALSRSMAVTLVYVFEAPAAGDVAEAGLLSREVLAGHLPPHVEHYQCFICGPPPMMDLAESLLLDLGIAPARIQTERFEVI